MLVDNDLTYHRYAVEILFESNSHEDGYYAVPADFCSFTEAGVPVFEKDDVGDEVVPEGFIWLDDNYDTADRMLALMFHLDDFDSVPTDRGNGVFVDGRREYLVLTDSEADKQCDAILDSNLNELLDEVPSWVRTYIDRDQWMVDHRTDRGAVLSGYDGDEHEESIDGCSFYIYRTN